jgi:hypothetical protein
MSTLEELSDSDLVIEAIIENLDIKRKLFSDLEIMFPRNHFSIQYIIIIHCFNCSFLSETRTRHWNSFFQSRAINAIG